MGLWKIINEMVEKRSGAVSKRILVGIRKGFRLWKILEKEE